jgi:phosphate transport system ATP-binding protein
MVKFNITNLNIWFASTHAVNNLNMDVYKNEILSVIGPANSGKTTFLRVLDRLNELEQSFRMSGKVELDKKDITLMDVESFRFRYPYLIMLRTGPGCTR